jgi:predicted RNase H-like HicB family nuclease
VDEGDGYSVIDTQTGVASQGETRREALRMLAEAIEAREGDSEMSPGEVYDELGVDPDGVPGDGSASSE